MSVCIEPRCEDDKWGSQSRCKGLPQCERASAVPQRSQVSRRLLARQRQRGTTPLRRRHLPAKIKEQNGRCAIYGEEIPQGKGQNHIDHRTPRSRGGTDDASNINVVCAPCNRRKGVKRMDELLAQIMLPFPVSQ